MLRRALACGALVLVVGCEGPPECRVGEVRYEGRPPRTLFAYDRTCREDCFSLPVTAANESRCDPTCEDVLVDAPTGALFDDKMLVLADLENLNRDGSSGQLLALTYRFGYVDEAGGNAPDAWGMTSVGPRTYIAGQVDGTARFVMDVGVTEVERDDTTGLLVTKSTVSESMEAYPGRLEVLEASPGRLAGRFFLAYGTPTEQPQGEVLGCFDVELGAEQAASGSAYQVIQP